MLDDFFLGRVEFVELLDEVFLLDLIELVLADLNLLKGR